MVWVGVSGDIIAKQVIRSELGLTATNGDHRRALAVPRFFDA
jgi:hypothetical protein